MKLKVLQRHIDYGKPGDPRNCAVAMALIERGYEQVKVDSTYVRVEDPKMPGWDCTAPVPLKMVLFIRTYDKEEGGCIPIDFDINLPPAKPEKNHEDHPAIPAVFVPDLELAEPCLV